MDPEQLRSLKDGLTALELDPSGVEAKALLSYIAEIELWNPKLGLVAPGEDIVARHILDSLSGLHVIQKLVPSTLADVGSGAGFPGIPLALWLPKCSVSLIERMGRRAGFLRNAVPVARLKNTSVIEKPVEEHAADGARYEVVTSRAWSAIDEDSLNAMSRILAPGGTIAAYKGRMDTIEAELNAVANRIAEKEILPLRSFVDEGPRHMVLLKLK